MPFTNQWTRDGKDISGAVGDTYQVNPIVDGGHTIYFRVVAAGPGGTTAAVSPGVQIPAVGSPLAISGTPPGGVVGQVYDFTPTVTGGTPPYTYSRPTGSAPTGTTFNGTTGRTNGTLTTAQVLTNNRIVVTDHAGGTATLGPFTTTIAASGTVVTPATWYAAWQAAAPGTVLLMQPGDYGNLQLYTTAKAAPGVTFQGQPGVTCNWIEIAGSSGLTVTGFTYTGLVNGQYGINIGGSDRIVVDRMTTPGNSPGTNHNGVGIYCRNSTNITLTNNTLTQLGDGIDGLDCSNVTISGNHITKISANFLFWTSVHTALIEKNYLANIDFITPGTHPDTIQLGGSGGSTGRNNDVTIRYNNYDAMTGSAAQGIGFCESTDRLTITGNCSFGALDNGQTVGDCTNVTITDNFDQGWTYSPRIYCRNGSNIVNMTGNWCASTPFALSPDSPMSTNVTIGVNTLIPNATSSTDTSLRNTWLTAHPLVPTS